MDDASLNQAGRSSAAAIEYYAYALDAYVCVTAPHLGEPVVVRAGPLPDGRRLDERHLRLCLLRLMVDVHGLPPRWDADDRSRAMYLAALALPPAVHAGKRSSPVRQQRLAKPAFAYGIDYLTELSCALVPEALRAAVEPYEQLCVIPHGALHGLPFGVLRWSAGELLAERFALSVLPAGALLPQVQRRNRRRVGPAHSPTSMAVVMAAAAEDDEELGFETEPELLRATAAQARVEIVTYDAATRDDLTAAAAHDVLHVACHGIFDAADNAQVLDTSGLLLYADGRPPSLVDRAPGAAPHLFSAREALGLGLNADLVTLRACSSGRSLVTGGDELLGLLRSLLFAGAPSVIAGLWNVNKESSRRLLSLFYERWLGTPGTTKAAALAWAQRRTREDPRYDHPFHWAAFALFGDWI